MQLVKPSGSGDHVGVARRLGGARTAGSCGVPGEHRVRGPPGLLRAGIRVSASSTLDPCVTSAENTGWCTATITVAVGGAALSSPPASSAARRRNWPPRDVGIEPTIHTQSWTASRRRWAERRGRGWAAAASWSGGDLSRTSSRRARACRRRRRARHHGYGNAKMGRRSRRRRRGTAAGSWPPPVGVDDVSRW